MLKVLSVVNTEEVSGGHGQAHLLARHLGHDLMYWRPVASSKTLEGENQGLKVYYPGYRIYDTVKELEPDVLLVHSLSTELASEAKALKKITRLVYVAHFQLYEHFLLDMFRGYLPTGHDFMEDSDLVICLSEKQRRILQEYSRARFQVIPPAIDYDYFIGLETEPVSNTFAMAGRLYPIKNHITPIMAMQRVGREYPDSFLSIYGDGYMHNDCSTMISYLGLTEYVALFGHLSHDKLISELCTCKALVNPSFIENNSVVEIEATALGMPIINGNSFSPRYYADKMIQVLDQYPEYREEAQKKREVAKRYNIPQIAKEYAKALMEVL